MEKEVLKNILLSTQCYLDNEYLSKYLDLIIANLDTSRLIYQTLSHHFIPVHCYNSVVDSTTDVRKARATLADLDPNNFTVNILYKDHVLSHYYLAKCASNSRTYCADATAVQYCLNHPQYKQIDSYESEYDFINQLLDLQEIYSDSKRRYWEDLSDEIKLEISALHSEIQKRVASEMSEEQKAKINIARQNAWEQHSDDTKQKYSQTCSENVTNIWSNRSKEERETIGKKISQTKKQKSQEVKDAEKAKWRESYAKQTEELREISRQRRKAAAQKSNAQRSISLKKTFASKDDEYWAERGQKAWATRRKNLKNNSK